MVRLVGGLALGVVAVGMAAGPALADTLTWGNPQWTEAGTTQTVTIQYSGPTVPSGDENPNGLNAYAGEMNLLDSTTGITYSVFCTDIFNTWAPGTGSYSLQQIQNASSFKTGNSNLTISATQFTQLQELLNGVSSTGYITNSITSAAVQVAVWEIENDINQAPSSYNFTSGGQFSITGNATVAQDAQTLVNYVDGQSVTQWTNTSGYLEEWTVTSGNQDFTFLAVGQTGHSSVPEPGSLAMLATGLAAFAAFRQRYARA
jgi:hypothetical protein